MPQLLKNTRLVFVDKDLRYKGRSFHHKNAERLLDYGLVTKTKIVDYERKVFIAVPKGHIR